MNVIQKKLSEIKPYEKNPRRNDEAVEFVANSIKQFGWKVPIVIDKDGVIVAGHTRYKAAQRLGIEEVPCVVADDLTPAQIKAYRIADNKVQDKAYWDDNLLKQELTDLIDDFNMGDFGFGDFELEVLQGDFEPEPFDKEVEEEYAPLEDNFLKVERVIITYTPDQKEALQEILGVDLSKVVYKAGEIIDQEDNPA